jgi:hypothetical protein
MRTLRAGAVVALLGLATAALGQDDGTKIRVKEGDSTPDFTLPAANAATVLPDRKDAKTLGPNDVKGKNVVLYFFPKAMTKG